MIRTYYTIAYMDMQIRSDHVTSHAWPWHVHVQTVCWTKSSNKGVCVHNTIPHQTIQLNSLRAQDASCTPSGTVIITRSHLCIFKESSTFIESAWSGMGDSSVENAPKSIRNLREV